MVPLTRAHEIFSYYPYSLNYSVFKAVQQGRTIHWTHGMLSCNPCSQNYSAVRAVRLNGTTLNSWSIVLWSFFPQLLASSSSSVGLNYVPQYHEIFSYDPYSLHYLLVQAVGWFQPTRTHKKLSYYPSFLNYWAVRAGLLGSIILRPLFPQLLANSSSSTRLNFTKFMKCSPIILVPSITP